MHIPCLACLGQFGVDLTALEKQAGCLNPPESLGHFHQVGKGSQRPCSDHIGSDRLDAVESASMDMGLGARNAKRLSEERYFAVIGFDEMHLRHS